MAKATVTCKCNTCGKDFVVTKICRNCSAATDFANYAATHYDECKDCFAQRMRDEQADCAAPIIAKYGIPKIKGVSDKQIVYANNLRNKFLSRCSEQRLHAASEADNVFANKQSTLQELADKEFGGDIEKAKIDRLKAAGLMQCYIILRESSAAKIIDTLTSWQ